MIFIDYIYKTIRVLSGMVEKMECSVSNLDALQEIVRKGHYTTLDQRENTTKCHNDLLKGKY